MLRDTSTLYELATSRLPAYPLYSLTSCVLSSVPRRALSGPGEEGEKDPEGGRGRGEEEDGGGGEARAEEQQLHRSLLPVCGGESADSLASDWTRSSERQQRAFNLEPEGVMICVTCVCRYPVSFVLICVCIDYIHRGPDHLFV